MSEWNESMGKLKKNIRLCINNLGNDKRYVIMDYRDPRVYVFTTDSKAKLKIWLKLNNVHLVLKNSVKDMNNHKFWLMDVVENS